MIPIIRLCRTTLYIFSCVHRFSVSPVGNLKWKALYPSPFSPPSGAINIHPTRYTLSSTLSLILRPTPILANSIRRSSRTQRYLLLSPVPHPHLTFVVTQSSFYCGISSDSSRVAWHGCQRGALYAMARISVSLSLRN